MKSLKTLTSKSKNLFTVLCIALCVLLCGGVFVNQNFSAQNIVAFADSTEKTAYYIDTTNGLDGTSDSNSVVHDGTATNKAWKTLEYALSNISNKSNSILYVCTSSIGLSTVAGVNNDGVYDFGGLTVKRYYNSSNTSDPLNLTGDVFVAVASANGNITVKNANVEGIGTSTAFAGTLLNVQDVSVDIYNSTFSNNKNSENGGAINSTGALTLTNCNINNAVSSKKGGGVYSEGSSLIVTNCEIYNNISNGAGGGLYNCTTVTGCKIYGNTANGGAGGGVYATNLEITNCELFNNKTTGHGNGGGGMFAIKANVFGDCYFYNNHTNWSGGGIGAENLTISGNCFVYDNKITNNRNHPFGGGIGGDSGVNIIIDGKCEVYDNSNMVGYSGGISYNNGTLTVNGVCNIHDNTSYESAGGLSGQFVYVNGVCNVYKNTSTTGGGGMSSSHGITITGTCNVYDNRGGNNGGGIDGFLTIGSSGVCNVYNNISDTKGGGIYSSGWNVQGILNVYNNTSKDAGGGIYVFAGWQFNTSSCKKLKIYNNISNGSIGGGGLCFSLDEDISLNNCELYNNIANNYGSFYCGGSLTLNSTKIYNNYSGGGCCCYVHGSTTISKDCVIKNNSVGDGGTCFLCNGNLIVNNVIDDINISNNVCAPTTYTFAQYLANANGEQNLDLTLVGSVWFLNSTTTETISLSEYMALTASEQERYTQKGNCLFVDFNSGTEDNLAVNSTTEIISVAKDYLTKFNFNLSCHFSNSAITSLIDAGTTSAKIVDVTSTNNKIGIDEIVKYDLTYQQIEYGGKNYLIKPYVYEGDLWVKIIEDKANSILFVSGDTACVYDSLSHNIRLNVLNASNLTNLQILYCLKADNSTPTDDEYVSEAPNLIKPTTSANGFALGYATVFYKISADGCTTVSGSSKIVINAKNVRIELNQPKFTSNFVFLSITKKATEVGEFLTGVRAIDGEGYDVAGSWYVDRDIQCTPTSYTFKNANLIFVPYSTLYSQATTSMNSFTFAMQNITKLYFKTVNGHTGFSSQEGNSYTQTLFYEHISGQKTLQNIVASLANNVTLEFRENYILTVDETITANSGVTWFTNNGSYLTSIIIPSGKTLTINTGDNIITFSNGNCPIFINYGTLIINGNVRFSGTNVSSRSNSYNDKPLNVGAVLQNYGTATINNCKFASLTATQGGAIYNEGTLNLSNCSFSSCSASTGCGGAIYNALAGIAFADECTFNSCSAKTYGGAIYNLGKFTLDFGNNAFVSNTATTSGTDVFFAEASNYRANTNDEYENLSAQKSTILDFETQSTTTGSSANSTITNSSSTSDFGSKFKLVEYIDSNSGAYINTKVAVSEDLKIEAELARVSTGGDQKLFGVTYSVTFGVLGSSWRFGYSGWNYNQVTTTNERTKIVMDSIEKKITIGDTSIDLGRSFSPTDRQIYFFALNGGNYNNQKRFYSFKIYKAGELIRDFVPCYCLEETINENGTTVASGTAGFYDLVEGKFYTNAGAGTFTCGDVVEGVYVYGFDGIVYDLPSDYQQVEYIESTGTQYIDLGICPTKNMKVELNINLIGSVRNAAMFGTDSFYNTVLRDYEGSWGLYGGNGNLFIDNGEAHSTAISSQGRFLGNILLILDNKISTMLIDQTTLYTFNDNNSAADKTRTMWLFSRNNTTYRTSYRCNYLKIWEGGVLIRNYVPCYRISDNIAGLYETVQGQFYTNSDSRNDNFNCGVNVVGNDNNDGFTASTPIQTLEKALEIAHAYGLSKFVVMKKLTISATEDKTYDFAGIEFVRYSEFSNSYVMLEVNACGKKCKIDNLNVKNGSLSPTGAILLNVFTDGKIDINNLNINDCYLSTNNVLNVNFKGAGTVNINNLNLLNNKCDALCVTSSSTNNDAEFNLTNSTFKSLDQTTKHRQIIINNIKNAKIYNCDISGGNFNVGYQNGGAAMAVYSSELSIKNCKIHNNFADGVYIGGDIVYFASSKVLMSNCKIFNNTNKYSNPRSDGLIYGTSSAVENLVIEYCDFYNNSRNYYCCSISNGTIKNCKFYNNLITALKATNSLVSDCEFYGNSSGLVCAGSQIYNCNIHNNFGDGIYFTGYSKSLVENCKICCNSGQGLSSDDDYGSTGSYDRIVRNCVIANNGECGFRFTYRAHLIIENCEIYGNKIGVSHGNPIEKLTVKNSNFYNNGNHISVSCRVSTVIENCTFGKTTSKLTGVSVSSNSFEMRNCNFNYLASVCVSISSTTSLSLIDGCTFAGCKGDNCVSCSGENLTLSNNMFYGCTATANIISCLNVEIENCEFINCCSISNNLVSLSKQSEISNCMLKANICLGGSVVSSNIIGVLGGNATVENCDLLINQTKNKFAVVYVKNGSLVFDDVYLSENCCLDESGENFVVCGVYCADGVLTIKNSLIENLSNITTKGFVIGNENATIKFEDCEISNCEFDNTYVFAIDCVANIKNLVVKNNTFANFGGLASGEGFITFENLQAFNNIGTNGGVGTFMADVVLVGNNTHVYNNNGTNGGAIYVGDGALLTIKDGVFDNNNGTNGGAIYVGLNGELVLTGGKFFENTATNGGAIYNLGSTTIENCEIGKQNFENTATNGGAIYNLGYLTINNATISYNKADVGAGIYNGSQSVDTNNDSVADATFVGYAVINNITLSNNEGFAGAETTKGAGIANNGGKLYIFGGKIENNALNSTNVQGGGIYVCGGYCEIDNFKLYGNNAHQLYLITGTVKLNNSTVDGNGKNGFYVFDNSTLITNNCLITKCVECLNSDATSYFEATNSTFNGGNSNLTLTTINAKFVECIFENCKFTDNNRLIKVLESGKIVINDCIFKNITNPYLLLSFSSGSHAYINNCTIENLTKTSGSQIIYIGDGAIVEFSGNTTFKNSDLSFAYTDYNNSNCYLSGKVVIANNKGNITIPSTKTYKLAGELAEDSEIWIEIADDMPVNSYVIGAANGYKITSQDLKAFKPKHLEGGAWVDSGNVILGLDATNNQIIVIKNANSIEGVFVSDKSSYTNGTYKNFVKADFTVITSSNQTLSQDDFEIEFSEKQNGVYTSICPKYAWVGSYTIYYKVFVLDNFGDRTSTTEDYSGSVVLNIVKKRLIVINTPTAYVENGETLSTAMFNGGKVIVSDGFEVAGSWKFEDGTITPTNTTMVYTAVFTAPSSNVYENTISIEIPVSFKFSSVTYNNKVVDASKAKNISRTENFYRYYEVEYIESTGTQYIDTGFVWSLNYQIDCCYEFKSVNSIAYIASTGKNGVASWNMDIGAIESNGSQLFRYNYSYSRTISCAVNTLYTVKYNEASTHKAYVNGTEISIYHSSYTYTGESTLTLFKQKYYDGSNFTMRGTTYAKLYYFKISDSNGTLVRDYVPVYDTVDKVYGLYDKANNVFYGSATSTNFIGGALKSNGYEVVSQTYYQTGFYNNATGAYTGFDKLQDIIPYLSQNANVVIDYPYSFENNSELETSKTINITSSKTINIFAGENLSGDMFTVPTGYNVNFSGKIVLNGNGGEIRYKELEYIESSGPEYIDTGYKPNQDTSCEVKLVHSGASRPLFGAWTGYCRGFAVYMTDSAIWYNYGSTDRSVGNFISNNNVLTYKIDKNNSALMQDDTILAQFSCDYSNFSCPKNFYLCSISEYGNGRCSMKLYACKIWDDGTLVRDFVPACDILTGKNGLLNLAYKAGQEDVYGLQFYASETDSNFIAGGSTGKYYRGGATQVNTFGENSYIESKLPEEYQAVEYIESTGTQYIDLGLPPQVGYQYYFDIQVVTVTNDSYVFGTGTYGSSNNFNYMHEGSGNTNTFFSVGSGYKVYNLIKTTRTKIFIDYDDVYYEQYNNGYAGNYTFIATANTTNTYNTWNMYLFSSNKNGSAATCAKMKLWSFEILDADNNYLRYMIPCYKTSDTSVVGMYDLVGQKFYANKGSGTFDKGENSNVYGTTRSDALFKVNKSSSLTLASGVEIKNWSFVKQAKVAFVNGGTLKIRGAKIYNNSFVNNNQTENANESDSMGAITNYGGKVEISSGVFNNNTFKSNFGACYGGIVCNDAGSVVISGGEFKDNSCYGLNGSYGGVVCLINNGQIVVNGGVFVRNYADFGGVVANIQGIITINGGATDSNNASSGNVVYNNEENSSNIVIYNDNNNFVSNNLSIMASTEQAGSNQNILIVIGCFAGFLVAVFVVSFGLKLSAKQKRNKK